MTRSRRRSLLRTFLLAGALAAIGCDKAPAPSPAAQPPLPAPPTGSRSTGPIAFASDRSGPSQIYLADEDGSVVTYLTEGSAPAWSPDGRQLAIQQAQQIVVINVDGSGRRVIGQGQAASWSPDGQQLALLSSNNNIEVVDVSGSNRRTLFASDWGVNSGPAWSPDGRLILFSLAFFIDVGTGLWTMSADGSGARDLNIWEGWTPAWSPDGRTIAYATNQGIWTANSDGSGKQLRLPNSAGGPVVGVVWTPDGRLAFSAQDAYDFRARARLYVNDAAGLRQLIPEATAPVRTPYRDLGLAWRR